MSPSGPLLVARLVEHVSLLETTQLENTDRSRSGLVVQRGRGGIEHDRARPAGERGAAGAVQELKRGARGPWPRPEMRGAGRVLTLHLFFSLHAKLATSNLLERKRDLLCDPRLIRAHYL